jgi:hypothetical protein
VTQPAMNPEPPSAVKTLQSQLETLQALSQRLTALRRAPSTLLQAKATDTADISVNIPETFPSSNSGVADFRSHVTQLRSLIEGITSSDSQAALKAAILSYKTDRTDVIPNPSGFGSKRK